MKTSLQHILIVSSEFPPQPGGIGNHAYNLAKYLAQQNYQVEVIADQRSELGNEEKEFDLQLPFKITRIKRFNWRFLMYLNRIAITYHRSRFSSHIFATGKFSLWNVAFVSQFCKAQTLAVIHGSEVNFKRRILKVSIEYALKRMDKIIGVSTYTKELIAHLDLDTTVIPNGIDVSQWTMKKASKINLKGSPILTTVGRVSDRKGQLNVIQNLPELIRQFPQLHYHCVGISTDTMKFVKFAQELGVEDHVTFHGSVKQEVLIDVLSKTDVFVMLSKESDTGDVEGFGIAILEANAMGIPAIGAKNCGIEDAIKNNESGLLVEANDYKAFVEAVDSILSQKDLFTNGALNWSAAHNWDTIIQSYIKLLQ